MIVPRCLSSPIKADSCFGKTSRASENGFVAWGSPELPRRGFYGVLSMAAILSARSIRLWTLWIASNSAVAFVVPLLIQRPIWNLYFQCPALPI